jgi:hypothetical protein
VAREAFAAMEAIYIAFCEYLDFLRRKLYVDSRDLPLDPMHAFRNGLERRIVYLDDAMAEKVQRYQGELLDFWNWAQMTLQREGDLGREKVRHRLDYEIPAYLPQLRRDLNTFLDPNYKGDGTIFDNLYVRMKRENLERVNQKAEASVG